MDPAIEISIFAVVPVILPSLEMRFHTRHQGVIDVDLQLVKTGIDSYGGRNRLVSWIRLLQLFDIDVDLGSKCLVSSPFREEVVQHCIHHPGSPAVQSSRPMPVFP